MAKPYRNSLLPPPGRAFGAVCYTRLALSASLFGLLLTGCNEPSEEGDTGSAETGELDSTAGNPGDGTDGGPIEGCHPDWDYGDGDGDPTLHLCEGSGNGWVRFHVYPKTAGDDEIHCVNSSVSGEDDPIEDCVPFPIDLEDVPSESGQEVAEPAACCFDNTDPDDITDACIKDCAWAACKLAAAKLQAAADALPNDPEVLDSIENVVKADLEAFADRLNTEDHLYDCANTVSEFGKPPYFAWYALGEGTSLPLTVGHITELELGLQCNVEDYEEDGACVESNNTLPEPEDPTGGAGSPSSIRFFGPYGEYSASISSATNTVSAPTCNPEPCDFDLLEFDVELYDFGASGILFEDTTMELTGTAYGSRTGTSVTIGTGALELEVHTTVKFGSSYLLGTSPFDLVFSNSAPVEATYSGGTFTIQEAEFQIGSQTAVLNTVPPTL